MINLKEKIKECMIHNPKLGGRYTFEIDIEEAEELMYLATGEYHNSKCTECSKKVSCVCTQCNHIWYCPKHIRDHIHKNKIPTYYTILSSK